VLDHARRPLAVLSIWGPHDRVHEGLFAELGAVAVRAAGRVSAAHPDTGWPGAPVVA
jgi:DNA-binding IclR family transcriptional regulator